MDHIDQTISHLKAQITALHNNTMAYQNYNPVTPVETINIDLLLEENTRFLSQIEELRRENNRLVQENTGLEADFEGSVDANADLVEEIQMLKEEIERLKEAYVYHSGG